MADSRIILYARICLRLEWPETVDDRILIG
jgi:hypothetical protein